MGELNYFLGLETIQRKDGIFIYQSKYIRELFKKNDLEDSSPTKTPMLTSTKLDQDKIDKKFDITSYIVQAAATHEQEATDQEAEAAMAEAELHHGNAQDLKLEATQEQEEPHEQTKGEGEHILLKEKVVQEDQPQRKDEPDQKNQDVYKPSFSPATQQTSSGLNTTTSEEPDTKGAGTLP
ncbi:hypothetical protein AgCh_028516 [Apium graveolens]